VGSPLLLTRILGLEGYRVVGWALEGEGVRSRLRLSIERRGSRRECSGCGQLTRRERDRRVRAYEDLPWGEHPVVLSYPLRRVVCRRCGIRTERVPFADPKARITRRLRQQIGLDCQSMPTSHAAIRHAVSWGKARRAEKGFLQDWDRSRPKRRPRHLGADEIQRGKGQSYWTVLTDLIRGEVIGLARNRDQEALTGLLETCLDARQKAAVEAVCVDMHVPYLNTIREVLPWAAVVFDKFHVLQHASAAIDDVRRNEFFRAGPVMREFGRGKRWLLLRRWKNVRGSKRLELQELFAHNRRLFRAYVLREELDRLWTYGTPGGVARFLGGWLRALRWQRLPEMQKLGMFLVRHIVGIAAYCDHPVRFGVVESVNTTIKAVLRKARGMRDEEMLLLKLKWATAHPIRSAADLDRFLHPETLHSNR
jgi:transposase